MGCLQRYQAEKMVEQATWTRSNNIKSWYSSKEDFVISLVGGKGIVYFELLPLKSNDQFCCLHWTTNEIKRCSWRKAARIDKSKRCYIPSWRCKATHIFGHSAKIIGAWLGCFAIHHIVLILHHLITFCFDLYKTPWMVKISIIMMISNRTWFSFLLIKTTSFMNMGLWCCLKDGERSLIKMGNALQNKVI